jgi:hypothetical protein
MTLYEIVTLGKDPFGSLRQEKNFHEFHIELRKGLRPHKPIYNGIDIDIL